MTKKNKLPTQITYQCPDCSRPMSKWSDGKTSKGKKESRIKCSQCGRWQWESDGKVMEL